MRRRAGEGEEDRPTQRIRSNLGKNDVAFGLGGGGKRRASAGEHFNQSDYGEMLSVFLASPWQSSGNSLTFI